MSEGSRSTLFLAHVLPKSMRKKWWALWVEDPHALAHCSFCGASRREVGFLLEAEHAYICDACIPLSVGMLAAHTGAKIMVDMFGAVLADRTIDPEKTAETDALLRSLLALGEVEPRAYGLVVMHAERLARVEIAREGRTRVPPGYR